VHTCRVSRAVTRGVRLWSTGRYSRLHIRVFSILSRKKRVTIRHGESRPVFNRRTNGRNDPA
jgi:hypothetical protein